jgi:hypothetical protein
MKEEPPVYDSL